MAQELELCATNITPNDKWIKKEAKWLVPEELSFLISGIHMFNQVSQLGDENDINVSMRMRAIRELTYFRSLMVAKIYRAGHMGIEEKKANYLLAGRATYFIRQSYRLFRLSEKPESLASAQLTEILPDFEKVTGLSLLHVEAGLFPKYE